MKLGVNGGFYKKIAKSAGSAADYESKQTCDSGAPSLKCSPSPSWGSGGASTCWVQRP